jgi:hypothetical protein
MRTRPWSATARRRSRKACWCRTGASPPPNWSRTSTASSTCWAPAARPATSRARRSRAATRSRTSLARVPDAAAEGAVRLGAVPQGRCEPGLPPVHPALVQPQPELHQPRGHAIAQLHVLRLLRALRLRALRQVVAADGAAAGAAEGPEVPAAHPVPGAARQPGQHKKRRRERHLRRCAGPRVRAAGQPVHRRHVRAEQRAPAAAVGHRPAVRPGRRQGRGGAQLRLPDHQRRAGVLRREGEHQPLHALGRQRHRDRRFRQRQLRPRPARLPGRGLRRRGDDPRAADRVPSHAARHAGLGLGLEEGGGAPLQPHLGAERPRQFGRRSRRTTSTWTRPTRTRGACRCCA